MDFTESDGVLPGSHAGGMYACTNTTEFDNLSPETKYQRCGGIYLIP
jgi:hypothetical protein